ncbi:nucleotide sugar dehydrogenase [Bacteroides cellulosilyticus]|uniref:nucleotide sugar dehydrogenase n=1 Tax=Bacteroides cellulosilyticus TaxID=246787 RepID=UPI00189AC3BF|nr:nucleotide sugar dehydrogenase [Bacteroides cellulosilyticus]
MKYTNITKDLNIHIAVIGLGYVGLPLLCFFSNVFDCCGFDINLNRIQELSLSKDSKRCVDIELLKSLSTAQLTSNWYDLKKYNYLIVAAPTPVDEYNKPDLRILKDICVNIGKVMTSGTTIVFESTVAPGTTEEICIPILENESGLQLNKGFFVGYSPERINVGDSKHTISSVPKLISGSNDQTLSRLISLYHTGLNCDVIPASSIKVAEATKLYENVQRDVLIALANQYSEYCRAEGIDIYEVTSHASTKWNFAEVFPGLVGGHCIGVDPYYLLERAKSKDSSLPLVELSRKVNEEVSNKITFQLITLCERYKSPSILVLGASYKPNTGDTRNSKALNIINSLSEHGIIVELFDPLCNKDVLNQLCPKVRIVNSPLECQCEIMAILVNHDVFSDISIPNTKHLVKLSELL